MDKGTPRTLLELLEKYEVEIPIIQRDYAQGRKDQHANMVRTNLLKDIKLAVTGQSPPLDLNFIYGKLAGEKFIPLDGQQRLTTLYLLYLYAFKDDENKTSIFDRFTYKTRISSRRFLRSINENRQSIFSNEKAPSIEIEDSIWFVPSWRFDPTIKSALTMLDAIYEMFKDIDDLDQLLDKEPLVFNFLDIENLGMEDTLYIKLNARGRPLSDFENFKAQLVGRLKELGLDEERKFEQCLDGKWTDLFWTEYKLEFDEPYLNFFGVLFMNKEILKNDNNWSNTMDWEKIDKDLFKIIYDTLNFIEKNPNRDDIREIFFNALSEKRTYEDRILFHGLVTYISKSKGEDLTGLDQWMRIIKNLTLNTRIDEIELYRRAIESINNMSANYMNILEYFSKDPRISGFSGEQIEEEKRKAKIILEDEDFAELIYTAEEHIYFSGQVRAALYYSQEKEDVYSKETFIYYWDKIALLFDESKPIHGNLLRRALLTLGDYTLPVSSYKTFCVDDPNEGARTPSMKRLFSNCGQMVKALLDKLDVENDIEDQLEKITYDADIPQTDWRYCFINYPSLFNVMSGSHLRLRSTSASMLIIPNKSSVGYNYGVYLLTLKFILDTNGIESKIIRGLGAWSDQYIELDDLFIRFDKGKYIVKDNKGKVVYETASNKPISEIEDYIIKNKDNN
ncbi:GmrSD restriction endonuclease domain-containing protein [Tissierella praeacuta]|uniref:GmrSD restriction endonuclease domain-containing protein n=1 Tax=Tissierella praeacuta TaxID=43131 RepID=UPI001C0FD6ED|nr:DUF262 domain-containing protein [Tissierella praeacuta]MBU5257237.1 DUF262 domain-containing protein [Tissierella praeacuta]